MRLCRGKLLEDIWIFKLKQIDQLHDPQILLSDGNSVKIHDTKSGNVTWIANGSWIDDVDYHLSLGYIFWSDFSVGTISRIKYPMEADTIAEIIITRKLYTSGVAVETVNSHLYWADCDEADDLTATYFTIHRSNLDGSDTVVIHTFSTQCINTIDIELDQINRWLYLTDWYSIKRFHFDGTNLETIVSIAGESYCDLELDLRENKMYWTDYSNKALKSSNLDGTGKILKHTSLDHLYGLAVTDNDIYFTSINEHELFKIKKNDSSLPTLVFSSRYFVSSIKIFKSKEYECFAYELLQNGEIRSRDFITEWSSNLPLSDDNLQMKWYRVYSNNGDEIAISAPGLNHCGTTYPIWFSGDLPNRGQTTSDWVCIQNATADCDRTIYINITNCGSYYVYYLNATDVGSAYCFGSGQVKCPEGFYSENGFYPNCSWSGQVKCPEGFYSENGFYPNCSLNYPNDTIVTSVKAELVDGPIFTAIPFNPKTPSLVPIFRCAFDEALTRDYAYDVYWYINDIEVIRYHSVSYLNINTTCLKPENWENKFQLNMEVRCAVRLRFSTNGTPGPFLNSSIYYAGLYPEKYQYTVVEGETLQIQLTSTVPVACMASHPNIIGHCFQDFYIFVPQSTDNGLSCTNNIANKNVVFKAEFCGVRIKTEDWNVPRSIEVVGYSDGMYNYRDRITYINISTSASKGMFSNVKTGLIKVTVIDNDSVLKNRQCQSVNDPHITTFDGKYYHFMDIGEHILYRNEKGPYWVHVLLTNCGFGWRGSACHCAVAIRSVNSLFVVRTCSKISRNNQYMLPEPVANLTTCDVDSLQVKSIHGGYKVILPSATEITIMVSRRWFISSLSIKPSVFDIDEAKGLCGVPNKLKDPSDDYTHREDGPVSDDQRFAKSWSVTNRDEKLFVDNPEFLGTIYSVIPDAPKTYCSCETTASHMGTIENHNSVWCNLTTPTQFCSSDTTLEYVITPYDTSCSSKIISKRSINAKNSKNHRARRSTDEFREYQSFAEEDNTDDDDALAPLSFRNGWTAENSWAHCIEKIRESLPKSLYSDFVELEENYFIESCVKDIELTGGTLFLEDTISAMVVFITTELVRNESLYLNNKTENGQSLFDFLTSQLCPKHCSGNGQCVKGVCLCSNEYVGDDCSFAISIPPNNISLPLNGLCKKGIYTCTVVSVNGNFLSETVWYQQRYFQIHGSLVTYVTDWVKYSAEFKSMFAVSVRLHSPSTQTKSLTNQAPMAEGYEIRMSYDGENFGESTSLIIFDEECYSCEATKKCIRLSGCPEEEPKDKSDSNEKSKFVLAIGVSLGIVCLLCLIIGLYVWKSKHSNKKQRVESCDNQGKDIYLKNRSRECTWISNSELELELQDFDFQERNYSHKSTQNQVPPKSHLNFS